MKNWDIFSVRIGIFENIFTSNPIIESYKNYINNLNFDNKDINISLDHDLLEKPLFKSLKNIILNNSKQYLISLGYVFEDLQISSSWATQTLKNQTSSFHNHANSHISGIYYLTFGSKIIFQNPLERNWLFQLEQNENSKTLASITPSPGLLVIFPSFLPHYIDYNSSDTPRISIAFNIIPKGEFGVITEKINLK